MENKILGKALWYANVYQYLSDRTIGEIETGYKRWCAHRQDYAALYKDAQLAQLIAARHPPMQDLPPSGLLFTFHYGPYRLLPRLLVAQGRRVALLASAAIVRREYTWYRQELAKAELPAQQLTCIAADDPMVLRRILRAVRDEGRLVLVFVDANEGLLSTRGIKDSTLEVPFGRSHFLWRTNLLRVADRFDLPIATVYLQQEDDTHWYMQVSGVLKRDDEADGPFFAAKVYQGVIRTFQQLMNSDWTAWENWSLLHAYGVDREPGALRKGVPNWMIPLTLHNKPYLFDVANRRFFAIQTVT